MNGDRKSKMEGGSRKVLVETHQCREAWIRRHRYTSWLLITLIEVAQIVFSQDERGKKRMSGKWKQETRYRLREDKTAVPDENSSSSVTVSTNKESRVAVLSSWPKALGSFFFALWRCAPRDFLQGLRLLDLRSLCAFLCFACPTLLLWILSLYIILATASCCGWC